MKYIRTKDNKIYELQEAKSGEKYLVRTNELIPSWNTNEYKILKQADTIEELCDEAVFFDKDNKPHYQSQEGSIWYLGAGLNTETLRLGIWTDKGLIYVAKMNSKEELELL